MCKCKWEKILEQHTPLVHFQWMQEGATLRATELKPRLDRYIVDLLKRESESIKKEWLLKSEKDAVALNYKMRISPIEPPVSEDIKLIGQDERAASFPMLLANMGKHEKEECCDLVCYKKIRVEFFCLIPKLRDVIRENFAPFLAINNFGNRKSKGFGSFYLERSEEGSCEIAFPEIEGMYVDHFDITNKDIDKFKGTKSSFFGLFRILELFCKFLRSGINECRLECLETNRECEYKEKIFKNGKSVYICKGGKKTNKRCRKGNISVFYLKSCMFKYAKSKEFDWEKRKYKELFSISCSTQQLEEGYLFRDLLGLESDRKESKFKIDGELRTIAVEKSDPNNAIERFSSPLLIKPIRQENGFRVYLIWKPILSGYLGKTMNVSLKENGIEKNYRGTIYPEFTIENFRAFLLKKQEGGKYGFELEDMVGFDEYKNDEIFKILKNIFDQLRR